MRKVLKRVEAAVVIAALVTGMAPVEQHTAEAAVAAKKIKASAGKKTLYIGWKKSKKTVRIKGKVLPKGASQKLTYKSSNKKVLKVNKKGVVTAVKAGKATVTVTSVAKKSLKAKIKLTVKNYDMAFASKTTDVVLDGESDTTKEKLTLYGYKNGKVTYSSDNEDVATVDSNGTVTGKKLGKAVITATSSKGRTATCTVKVTRMERAIHDPSVYRDEISGKYYTFGSHLMTAVSGNLIGWSTAANSGSSYSSSSTLFTKVYTEEFAEPYAYTMPGGARENAWAPCIIYNKSMKKYCMYISIVDGSTKCCIAMASSDKPDGPYQYQGMIVCSGMETDGSDIGKTNVAEALGITDAEAKASKYASLGSNSPDCIDATVFYDHNGLLWMVYGSFTTTGGIRLLKLNPDTGLRGENYADSGDGTDQTLSTDDPYFGKKIANSNGEGPFIQMLADKNSSTGYYYYLWTSVGNLQYYGGYNMRMVRAENPEGPYYDPKGNEAAADLQKYALGLRVMDNYQFSFMDSAFVSQGGNSATDDGNGKTFIQFHTRTSASDSFTLRTHQTFANEDGWLVTAPYEYNGETIAENYEIADVAGDYEFIYHRTGFAKTTIDNMDYTTSQKITLNVDGTVSGAYSGTWSLSGHYFTININDKTYKGVVLEQYEQTAKREKVMVFTGVGDDNRSVWGSKMHKTDSAAVKYDANALEVAESATKDFSLVTEGLFGSRITWSSNQQAIAVEGNTAKVTRGNNAVEVTLTASITKGSSTETKSFTVKVEKQALEIDKAIQGDAITLPNQFAGEAVTWTSSDTNVIRTDGTVIRPESGYRKVTLTAAHGGKQEQFEVIVLADDGEMLYSDDYTDLVSDVAIAGVWTSRDKQNCLYVEADETHESFIKFAGGNTGTSQGAQSIFGMDAQVDKNYTVEFDVALDAGTREATEFAVIAKDVAYKNGDTNAGLESGYIVKLSATNSKVWSINDTAGSSFELPLGWVHVKAVVGENPSKAAVIISDAENIYYCGEVDVNGAGVLSGLYLRWGCIQALVSVDNVEVHR